MFLRNILGFFVLSKVLIGSRQGQPVRRQGATKDEGEDLIRSSPSNVSWTILAFPNKYKNKCLQNGVSLLRYFP